MRIFGGVSYDQYFIEEMQTLVAVVQRCQIEYKHKFESLKGKTYLDAKRKWRVTDLPKCRDILPKHSGLTIPNCVQRKTMTIREEKD